MASAAPVVNVSEFLRELVLVLPGTVHAHASVLLPHLSSRPYQIRNAVVFSLAEVVSAAHEERRRAAEEGGGGGAVPSAGNDGGEGDSQVPLVTRLRFRAFVCYGRLPTRWHAVALDDTIDSSRCIYSTQ